MTEEEIYGTPPSVGRLLARIAQLEGALDKIVALGEKEWGQGDWEQYGTDCTTADRFKESLKIALEVRPAEWAKKP